MAENRCKGRRNTGLLQERSGENHRVGNLLFSPRSSFHACWRIGEGGREKKRKQKKRRGQPVWLPPSVYPYRIVNKVNWDFRIGFLYRKPFHLSNLAIFPQMAIVPSKKRRLKVVLVVRGAEKQTLVLKKAFQHFREEVGIVP